jgi:predicted branched-subunit amino acid permease
MSNSSNSSLSNPSGLAPTLLKEAQQQALFAGMKKGLPTLPGVAAWGMVVGVAMIKTHFTLGQALGMSLFVFAGSAQLAALPLMAVDAPIWIIFLTGFLVNLRFVIFSVILAPHFQHIPWRQRLFWSYLTSDVSIVFFMQRYPTKQPEAGKFEFLKGLLIPNWITWQIGTITGILLGSQIPQEWGLGFAGTLAVLCILLPMVLNRAALVGVIAAGTIALFTTHWPYKLGMLLAVIIGMICSMIWEEWVETRVNNKALS